MYSENKKNVALLDVDGTLIFGDEENVTYNDNLIDTLIENGVTDVYIFSSMNLNERLIKERGDLINHLKSRGLTVHGLICSADLIWNKDKAVIKAFYEEYEKTRTPQEVLALLQNEKFKSLTNFDGAIPGQGYETLTNAKTQWTSEDANMYHNVVSVIRSVYLDPKNSGEYAHDIAKNEKSYFYQMFAANKPEWSDDIIFVDDADVNIQAVKGMHNQLDPEYNLLTVYNLSKENGKENPSSFYSALIEPFVALLNSLNEYRSGRSWTHSEEKFDILTRFKEELKYCESPKQIETLKTLFAEDYKFLNTHRFDFLSTEKTRSAQAFDKMIEARKEQLDPKIRAKESKEELKLLRSIEINKEVELNVPQGETHVESRAPCM